LGRASRTAPTPDRRWALTRHRWYVPAVDQVRGKVAVVTGGASGIGRAMAVRFVEAGMDVVIADIEEAVLAATASELGVAGIVTDVADADSVAALADATIERFGAVHLVCNNAGVGGGGAIRDLTLNDWQWVIDVNLWGVIHGVHMFLPHLLRNPDGGHIVNTASVAGLVAGPGIGPYNASKYAVVAISETLAAELAADGAPVGVSVLCPGLVRTSIFTSQRNRPAELRNETPKSEARAANEEIAQALLAEGIDPSIVAGKVLDAVVADQFWIITHPQYLPAVAERMARIQAAVAAG
jgi:NAD(P)-dependent dehydrogenase (short-subunit alcohol dehydrogenase family)